MLVDVQDMRCVLTVFLARKTSLSASSVLRHHTPLLLHTTNLGSKVSSVWMNLQLFHCIYGHHICSDMQCDGILKSCPLGLFLVIRVTLIE